MKTCIALSTALLLGILPLFSQDFSPFNPGYRYHYQEEGADHITALLFADSITLEENDSLFHLNRIVTDCDTCTVTSGFPGPAVLLNQPQFLGHTVIRQENGLFRFEGRDTFWLHPAATVGDPWIFNPAGTQEASVAAVEVQEVFGEPETVKVIGATDGRTFHLSEHYGLIRYETPETAYDLAGVDGPDRGERLPEFFDFFNFEVGDVYQYRGFYSFFAIDPFSIDYTEKITILEKEDLGATLSYRVHRLRRALRYDGSYDELFLDGETYLNFTYDPNHPTALYPGAAMANPLSLPPNSDYEEGEFGRISAYRDGASGRTGKIVGGWTPEDGPSLYPLFMPDATQPGLGQPCCADEFYARYEEGLGLVYLHLFYFEVNEDRWLEGYVQDGDTTGVISPDSLLVSAGREVRAVEKPLTVYPNPAGEVLWVEMPREVVQPVRVTIFDGQGRLVGRKQRAFSIGPLELDVSLLPAGMYWLEVRAGERVFRTRWVIKM